MDGVWAIGDEDWKQDIALSFRQVGVADVPCGRERDAIQAVRWGQILSLDFELREQRLFTVFGGTLSIRYPVPTAIKPFLGVGAGGSYKVEAPGPSTTLIEVKVDNSGNKTSSGVLLGK